MTTPLITASLEYLNSGETSFHINEGYATNSPENRAMNMSQDARRHSQYVNNMENTIPGHKEAIDVHKKAIDAWRALPHAPESATSIKSHEQAIANHNKSIETITAQHKKWGIGK